MKEQLREEKLATLTSETQGNIFVVISKLEITP